MVILHLGDTIWRMQSSLVPLTIERSGDVTLPWKRPSFASNIFGASQTTAGIKSNSTP